MAEYLILVGMSGAGRSTAAATFEDRGWFVIDNLPPALIGKIAELTSQAGAEYERVCLVSGRGGYEGIAELAPEIRGLRSTGARVRVVFLDASDEVLVRRYEGTRRRHPVEAASVLSAIQQEREMLQVLHDEADVVGETGNLNVHELRDRLIEVVDGVDTLAGMQIAVVSFGFKHGIPLDVDLVFDCRFLPNPHWVSSLRNLSGLDPQVRDYVLGNEEAEELLRRLDDLFALLLPAYVREGKSYLSIAIGCTGGRHRSVVLADEIAERIRRHGYVPVVHHRDINR